jgi:hypothetical protein
MFPSYHTDTLTTKRLCPLTKSINVLAYFKLRFVLKLLLLSCFKSLPQVLDLGQVLLTGSLNVIKRWTLRGPCHHTLATSYGPSCTRLLLVSTWTSQVSLCILKKSIKHFTLSEEEHC